MILARQSRPVFSSGLAVVLVLSVSAARADAQSYRIESINDSLFESFPPPAPVRRVEHSFNITQRQHTQAIRVDSLRLRNLSITLENLGSGLIENPHLFGPQGWDFRSLEAIAASITSDSGLTNDEKFLRVHEWMGLHTTTVLGGSFEPYKDLDFSSNPLRNLNQYGHAMCGQSTYLINALLRAVPPIGSRRARNVKLGAHRVGEGYWDGSWHAFDATPGTGVVQWVYYDEDNRTIAPGWQYLISRPDLVSRIEPLTSATTARYLSGATGSTYGENPSFKEWDFNHDLRPDESLTMHFDMRGRLDRTSARQDNSELYRAYSDYASAVYRYAPDLSGQAFSPYVRQTNVVRTSRGLVPKDPSRPSSIILEMKSTWCFAGSEVEARFRTEGNVYVGVRSDPYATSYSASDVSWRLLVPGVEEYDEHSIEGKMAYWLMLEFQGEGSGLEAVSVESEVQMSPWSMPGLRYGTNQIRFQAASMGSSTLRVTYEYDDRSPFHSYQPATSDYGRHIPVRVGGILHRGSKQSRFDHGKGRFWDRVTTSPRKTIATKVEIFDVSGERAGDKVRSLVNRALTPGWYEFFWNGRDDSGRLLPSGMYSYRLTFDGSIVNGERLYLFDRIWPVPNERRPENLPGGRIVVNPETPVVDQAVRFTLTGQNCEGGSPFCRWDMGDGTLIEGDAPIHVYIKPGTYTVLANGLDEAGREVIGSAVVPVEHRVFEPLPEDPAPGEPGAGEASLSPLTVQKLSAKLRYDIDRPQGSPADAAFLRILLPNVPAGWDPAGQAFRIDIGGAQAEFLLDRKGRGRGPSGAVRLQFRRVKGEFPGGSVIARLALRGDWANEWLDEGIEPGDDQSASDVSLGIRVDLEDLSFASGVTPSVTSRPGKFAWIVFGR